jgi:hypothetical protein
MSFENLKLTNSVLAHLYGKSLAIVNDSSKTIIKATSVVNKKWFLGDNKKNILIICADETAVYLREELLQLLTNMLQACALNMGDVALVNLAKKNLKFIELKEKLQPAYCLLFGISTTQIDLPFVVPNYQIQNYNQCTFLLAPDLETMLPSTAESKLEKSKLWMSLKKIFNV